MIERILKHRGAAALAGQPIGAAKHFPTPDDSRCASGHQ